MLKLFVGGFPLESTELEIVQLISPYATVSTIKIVRDKISRKCKGYAFVEITDDSSAANVIDALDNTQMGDRVLTINVVTEKPATAYRPKPSSGGYKKPYASSPTSSSSSPYAASKPKRPRRSV